MPAFFDVIVPPFTRQYHATSHIWITVHVLALSVLTSQCWCGDASTEYDKNGLSEGCTFECPGDSTDICGGRWAASVFEF